MPGDRSTSIRIVRLVSTDLFGIARPRQSPMSSAYAPSTRVTSGRPRRLPSTSGKTCQTTIAWHSHDLSGHRRIDYPCVAAGYGGCAVQCPPWRYGGTHASGCSCPSVGCRGRSRNRHHVRPRTEMHAPEQLWSCAIRDGPVVQQCGDRRCRAFCGRSVPLPAGYGHPSVRDLQRARCWADGD